MASVAVEERNSVPTAADIVNNAAPFHLTDVDREVLSQTDETFHLMTWDDLKEIICR